MPLVRKCVMRKTFHEQRAEKLAQIDALRQTLIRLEHQSAQRIGKIAMRAGVAELGLRDETRFKAVQELAGRFQSSQKEPDSQTSDASESLRACVAQRPRACRKQGDAPHDSTVAVG